MVLISDTELVDAWIKYCKSNIPDHDNEFFELAYEVYEAADTNPLRCCSIMQEILLRTEDEEVLQRLGTGPMENLLHNHIDEALHWIKSECSKRGRLRKVLHYVDQSVLSDDEWESILHYVDQSILSNDE